MGGTVQTDTAGVAAASDQLTDLAGDITAGGRCLGVSIAGDDGSLARAIADLTSAEAQVSAAIAAELRRSARILDGLHADALAADR